MISDGLPAGAAATAVAPQPLIEERIYRQRFSEEDLRMQRCLWKEICAYLQRFVDRDGATLDLGAGFCHFINAIQSREKVAVDMNPDNMSRFANSDVRCIVSNGADLKDVESDSIDTVFASNVYEHFLTREQVALSFQEAYRVLRPSGRFVIMQPNFAFCSRNYFDFFDHRLAFTHRAIEEGLRMTGFEITKAVARFLPYSTKSRLPTAPFLVRIYLRMPVFWRIFGAQMLVVAHKP